MSKKIKHSEPERHEGLGSFLHVPEDMDYKGMKTAESLFGKIPEDHPLFGMKFHYYEDKEKGEK